MKVLEFHPDELLDREMSGTLSPEDRRRLDNHLEHCASCCLERQLRLDFEEELGPEGKPPSLQVFVSGALRAAESRRTKEEIEFAEGVPSTASNARRSRLRRFIYLLAATMALCTSIATAQRGLAAKVLDFARQEIAAVFGPFRSEKTPPLRSKIARSTAPPKARTVSGTAPLLEAMAPQPRAAVLKVKPEHSAPNKRHARDTSFEAQPEHVIESPPRELGSPVGTSSSETVVRLPEFASSMFDRANAARRQGNSTEASALYRLLRSQFPESSEARLSLAILARMELDRGKATAALAGFRVYLATGDQALREEAMVGTALALRRLGRHAEEKQAWQELLEAFPRSPYGRIAYQRMDETAP